MILTATQMEEKALLQVAAQMCAAARTAPKAIGRDTVHTVVLTDDDKDAMARQMEEIGKQKFADGGKAWYCRDADNVRNAQAVVLIGTTRGYRGIANCGYCGFANCGECQKAGATCMFTAVDLGVALSSAVSVAADARVDNRIMMSVGKAAEEMIVSEENIFWLGIPLSIRGKNVFFDRMQR